MPVLLFLSFISRLISIPLAWSRIIGAAVMVASVPFSGRLLESFPWLPRVVVAGGHVSTLRHRGVGRVSRTKISLANVSIFTACILCWPRNSSRNRIVARNWTPPDFISEMITRLPPPLPFPPARTCTGSRGDKKAKSLFEHFFFFFFQRPDELCKCFEREWLYLRVFPFSYAREA